MSSAMIGIIPVLPSQDIDRDVKWYNEKVGFECAYSDNMYAVIYKENIRLHLQWHADTANDPLLGGSVIRIYVSDIKQIFQEMVQRGSTSSDKLRLNTPWGTHEFGFFDLNKNAIFIVQDLE